MSNPVVTKRSFITIVTTLNILCGFSSIQGQTNYYWSGGGANTSFTTAGNFKSTATGSTNSTPSSSDINIFNFGTQTATVTTANNPTAGFNLREIIFHNDSGQSFTISGAALEFKIVGSAAVTQNSAQTQTISAGITLAEAMNLRGNGTGLVTLSGAWVGGTKGIIKSGSSSFLITQSATTAGTVAINAGTIALSGSGALGLVQLRGGVLATSGTFSRTLGTGATNFNFGAGGGGFAAYGGALAVTTNLGTWASTANSLANNTPLILGSAIADNVVTLSNALNLGGAVRVIRLVDNVNSSADRARISGVLSNGGLNITGSGILELTAANTYVGNTTVGSGAVLNIQNATALGTTAAGTTVSSGGSLEVQSVSGISVGAEALNLNGMGVGGNGALRNLLGNNTYGGLISLSGATRIQSDSGKLNISNAGSIAGSGFDLTFAGAGDFTVASSIGTGAGAVTKTGAGLLELTGQNTFSGLTTVQEGTLLVNNLSGSATGTGSVQVNGSSTLGGSGRIAPTAGNNITINGNLLVGSVGGSAETLDLVLDGGLFELGNTSTTYFDLFGGYDSGELTMLLGDNDKLSFAGSMFGSSMNPNGTLSVTAFNVSNWAAGSAWRIIDWGGYAPSGTFSSYDLPDISTYDLHWDTSALYTDGIIAINVPEPSGAVLVLIAATGMFFRRRR